MTNKPHVAKRPDLAVLTVVSGKLQGGLEALSAGRGMTCSHALETVTTVPWRETVGAVVAQVWKEVA